MSITAIMASKTEADLQSVELIKEPTDEQVEAVIEELRKGLVWGPYTLIAHITGVDEDTIKEIHEEMNSKLVIEEQSQEPELTEK